jgi:hypothetical protein
MFLIELILVFLIVIGYYNSNHMCVISATQVDAQAARVEKAVRCLKLANS